MQQIMTAIRAALTAIFPGEYPAMQDRTGIALAAGGALLPAMEHLP